MSTLIKSRFEKQTATWGGNLARTTSTNGMWLGIPTGHQQSYIAFGTTIGGPDADYNPSTSADDLCSCIWQPFLTIIVTGCKIFYGQGGSTNTRHTLVLMRYDIDADGTLSNGAEVAGPATDLGTDDYTTLASMNLSLTSAIRILASQVLIGMVWQLTGSNSALGCKVILEYRRV